LEQIQLIRFGVIWTGSTGFTFCCILALNN